MTFEENLVRTLDGQASPIDEETLMAQMAVSPEKRSLFHEHLRMREAIARDGSALRPSRALRDSTIAVMIGAMGATIASSVPRFANAGKLRGWSRAAFLSAGAGIGALATYGVIALTGSPSPAPQPQPTIIQVDTAARTAPAVVERIVMSTPETVRVAMKPIVVHDTVIRLSPSGRVISPGSIEASSSDTTYPTLKADPR